MRLDQITRYPVKSLQGEMVPTAVIDGDGLRGDRCWGIRDEGTGKILTARREPRCSPQRRWLPTVSQC